MLRKVVYVEDNDANFALVQRVLEADGSFEVLRAADGPTALALIAEQRPHVVLLDLDLPGMNGTEIAKTLRADPELDGLPILVITASVMERERAMAMEAGADAFIEKPFDIARLREIVRQHAGL